MTPPDTTDDAFSGYTRALAALDQYMASATAALAQRVAHSGKPLAQAIETAQIAAHGLAWLATTTEGLRQLLAWAVQRKAAGRLRELDSLKLQIAFCDYLAQATGRLPIGPGETAGPADMGAAAAAHVLLAHADVRGMVMNHDLTEARMRAAQLVAENSETAIDADSDPTLAQFQEQIRRFVSKEVSPHAHRWHRENMLIPRSVLDGMSEMGVFGLTIAQSNGGLGVGKLAMCVVTEELSRGYIGVGSIGTRSEIAAELIAGGGTAAQKSYWLPRIANGTCISTAAFTEPNAGSDLANVQTRARRAADGNWRVTGAKTWMTHGARADLMIMLVRTSTTELGYKGLSILLAPKTPGTDAVPFCDPGISGSEIHVLGYRGMKEYAVAFDDFPVAAENLLGETEGSGFKHLMTTFESARIQTAARAVGVAQNALDLALRYAQDRMQFGRPLLGFPRVATKIAAMATEIEIARQLAYAAARRKDQGVRCDMEAGMAKLLASRVAWTCADAAVQIHGGNGYAEEFPISRVLCDARILSIFEGAAEIQAEVIARGLLGKHAV